MRYTPAFWAKALAICFTAIFTFMADTLPAGRFNQGIGMFGISGRLCAAGMRSGIGHGLLLPILNTMAVRNEPATTRGKATGLCTGGIDTGIFAGSLFLGYIGGWFGLLSCFSAQG